MRELMLLLRWQGRKFDDEGGSSAWLALHVHGSAVSFHNLLYQVQPKASSVNLIAHRFLTSKEGIENVVLFFARDAGPPVLDADLDHGSACAGCSTREQSDPLHAIRSIFYGVVDQILESVPQRHGIAQNGRQARFYLGVDAAHRLFQNAARGKQAVFNEGFDRERLALMN